MLSCSNENTVSVNDDKTNEDANNPSDNTPNTPSTAKISVKSNVPYEICIYSDSVRQNLVARIPANESAIFETEQIGEVIFYYTFFISPENDSSITIPFYDGNCTFKLATSIDKVAEQTISSPKSISLSSCFIVLKNESERTIQLMNESSAISPYQTANTTSAFISPSESACYEIKEKNFDNIGAYSVQEASGDISMPLADIIPAFERCKIYTVVYGGKSIQLANTIGQEELIGMKAYTVMHKCERVDSEEYETSENETVYGFPEEMTEAVSKEYEGFEAEDFEQQEIASDGSTQIEIRYKRIRTTLTFNANGGAFSDGSDVKKLKGKFGAKVEIENPVWANIDFLGWDAELPETFGIESKTFSARWTSLIVEATESTVYDKIISCDSSKYTYTIKLKGPIEDRGTTLYYVARALYENNRISFILDISEANGITELGSRSFCWNSNKCSNLVGIVLNDEIKTIGCSAFKDCAGLKSVEIPDSVTEISSGAFEGCTNLQEANIGNGVWIGEAVFSGCVSLKEMTLPMTQNSYSFGYIFGSLSYEEGVAVSQGNKLWYIPSSLKKVTITDGKIEYMFSNCTMLESVVISNASIGRYAFENCTSLKNIIILDSVALIDDFAFKGCTALEGVTFAPESKLEKIGAYVFQDCSALINIAIPASVTSIGTCPFTGCTALERVIFSAGIKLEAIEGGMFRNCSSLSEITIPASVTSIGSGAFNGCISLKNVTFADTNGWRYYTDSSKNSSESDTVTDAATNATNLKNSNGVRGKYGMFKE